MTPTDWISMGDELRVELDRLELEALAWAEQFVPLWLEPDLHHEARARVLALPLKERDPLCIQAYGRGRLGGRTFYRDALAKLRSHGRAKDWPERPWTEEERG